METTTHWQDCKVKFQRMTLESISSNLNGKLLVMFQFKENSKLIL